jgi:hypothetical protein
MFGGLEGCGQPQVADVIAGNKIKFAGTENANGRAEKSKILDDECGA